MQKLEIAPTKTTLGICFDHELHILAFYGVSYPTNPITFFQPLIDWVEEYLLFFGDSQVTLKFELNYFNTSTSVYLFKILELFDKQHEKFNNVRILWHNINEDEDVLDAWKSLLADLDLPYNIVNVNT